MTTCRVIRRGKNRIKDVRTGLPSFLLKYTIVKIPKYRDVYGNL
jgi:hypothetical protein